jgi:hypothetical protein
MQLEFDSKQFKDYQVVAVALYGALVGAGMGY